MLLYPIRKKGANLLKRFFQGLAASAGLLLGCGQDESKVQQQGSKVEINAGGVNIKAGETGAEITLPGSSGNK